MFEAFLIANPAFTRHVTLVEQPDVEFPDVIVTLADGAQVNFELGEWLDGGQMAQNKRRERLDAKIIEAIGHQMDPRSPYVHSIMLSPQPGAVLLEPRDAAAFGAAIWHLIRETDARWPEQKIWHSPQGRLCRDFPTYPVLGKYLSSVHFWPRVVDGKDCGPRPPEVPWIVMEAWGGAYDPGVARNALAAILDKKIRRYGDFKEEEVRLLIYYGRAIVYNTPYRGVDLSEFRDVAALGAEVVRGQSRFERIYLLNALTPGLQAFEIFPALSECR